MSQEVTTVVAALAMRLGAMRNIERAEEAGTCNDLQREWRDRHALAVHSLERNFLPSGSGFDAGTLVDEDNSRDDQLVFITQYHHMEEGGYTGWTKHIVRVKPCFDGSLDIRVGGVNRNSIKDYIADTFRSALHTRVKLAGTAAMRYIYAD